MIIEISICYDYFPTTVLEAILRNDLDQGELSFLSEDAILYICSILCKRRPYKDPKRETRKEEIWRELQAEFYDPEKEKE